MNIDLGVWYDKVFEFTLNDLEGGLKESNLKGDKGGETYAGIASNVHPKLYKSLKEDGFPLAGIKKFYEQYIPLHISVAMFPRLSALLFMGGVHGTGDNDYVLQIQIWLNKLNMNHLDAKVTLDEDGVLGPITAKVLNDYAKLGISQRFDVDGYIMQSLQELSRQFADRRVRAVGSKSLNVGIANRVHKELTFA